ncbi:MAG: PEP-utilizing enzyme [Dehalococcoidia bacterium]
MTSASVDWSLPEGSQTLYWDHIHFPRPLSPLGVDFIRRWMMGGGSGRRVINGYVFRPYPSFGGFELEEYRVSPSYDIPDPVRIWEDETLPYIEAIVDRIRTIDYESYDIERLVGLLPSIFQSCGDAMRLTMNPWSVFNARTARLLTYVEDALGDGAALQVVTMLQGLTNASAESGTALGDLAEIALSEPEVKAAVLEGRFEDLEALPAAAHFIVVLKSYLHEFGWRSPTWGELHVPTWAEDPTQALALIRRFVQDPSRMPAAAVARARQQRDAAVRDAEEKLGAERTPEFHRLLAEAEAHVPVCESRAMWQLISCGIARIPLLVLGRKLVEAGALHEAEDIFYVRLGELQAIAAGTGSIEPEEIEQRRADLELWSRSMPPVVLGKASPWRVRDWYGDPGSDVRIVRGVGASKGVVTATARIIRGLDDADHLQAGDVLVCSSTAPPWTPMFAIASAVVTNSGGILSHSAIAAREYGIPAVVGTQVGTQRIPDGATVTVDGEKGIVRIE